MLYLLHVRTDDTKKYTFRIVANSEAEAKEKLPSRLPPEKRTNYILDSIEIDPKSMGNDELYGVFLNE
jgi:hypothetical protein